MSFHIMSVGGGGAESIGGRHAGGDLMRSRRPLGSSCPLTWAPHRPPHASRVGTPTRPNPRYRPPFCPVSSSRIRKIKYLLYHVCFISQCEHNVPNFLFAESHNTQITRSLDSFEKYKSTDAHNRSQLTVEQRQS